VYIGASDVLPEALDAPHFLKSLCRFESLMTQQPSPAARGPFCFDELPELHPGSSISVRDTKTPPKMTQEKVVPKYRVLIVEDDEAIARLLGVNLQKAGLGFEFAGDGAAGLRAFQENAPHLVLLDLMLPGMNGFAVCAEIRKTSRAPVIMMTARIETTHQMRGFRLGADDYVLKPFDPQLLVARVIAHLRRVYQYQNGTAPANNETTFTPKQRLESRDRVDSAMPEGWAGCSSCDYMGPLKKFPRRSDGHGQNVLSCPHCGTEKSVQFVLD
jgi:CheY-like chemotaxis protein